MICIGHGNGAKSEILLANAEAFDVKERLTKANVRAPWSAGDNFITMPGPDGGNAGVLREAGSWNEINYPKDLSCPNSLVAVPGGHVIGFGCGGAWVVSTNGDRVFDYSGSEKDLVAAVAAQNNLLALRIDRKKTSWFDSFIRSKPSELVVVNLATKSTSSKIPLNDLKEPIYFDISEAGPAIVADGKVNFYKIDSVRPQITH